MLPNSKIRNARNAGIARMPGMPECQECWECWNAGMLGMPECRKAGNAGNAWNSESPIESHISHCYDFVKRRTLSAFSKRHSRLSNVCLSRRSRFVYFLKIQCVPCCSWILNVSMCFIERSWWFLSLKIWLLRVLSTIKFCCFGKQVSSLFVFLKIKCYHMVYRKVMVAPCLEIVVVPRYLCRT